MFARRIRTNMTFARQMSEKHDDSAPGTFIVSQNEGETLSFDLNNFRMGNKSYGGITSMAKEILKIPSIDRTDEHCILLRVG